MRGAFFQALMEVARQDSRVHLVVGDLGFGVVEPFAREFPRQFLNAGVAEQNMTGVAAGLALAGKIVYTYSIANFPTLRCLEQIRNDICYHEANVKIVAVGGGFAYGSLGMTHHATEDLAIMRALPGMTVVAPGDPYEAAAATKALAAHPGPAYLRLGRAGEPAVHDGAPPFQIGKAIQIVPGTELTLISTGGMLQSTMHAAQLLMRQGVSAAVLSMHTIKPLDEESVMRAAKHTRAILTVEEHSALGGLGGAVAELLAESSQRDVRFRRVALPSEFSRFVGSQEYQRGRFGLAPESIAKEALALLRPESAVTVHA